ncbi:hypothetical protein PAF17_09470 [Paracoccus sp. Z330]|uniref:L-fucose isomerase C-terminal domain-containing protein n=1 Tax=Paracoccus onchidii TaxID=3017813 RepID=A0ABT4ZEQ1_9RHOB|nr:hypothetical protein [Paracoccus onchidii]MDB6177739.1 hypothetical protein [Paracoccus onchidii]
MTLVVGLIKASLPSYFPQRHGVFDDALAAVEKIAAMTGARLVEAPGVPMNGAEAQGALDHCRGQGADFILLLHGGFTMGDVARQIALSGLPMGVWATPEPGHEGDIQLNNFVSLNMSMSIARGVRDLRKAPVQWYFGAPDDIALQARLGRSFRALSAKVALRDARIGVIGGLAPTFYNMDISADTLKVVTGAEPVHVDMCRLTARMKNCAYDSVQREVAAMAARAEIHGVSDEQMALTAQAALALREIVAQEGFAGLAVSDWPALQEDPGMHPGAAFSWLEEVDNLPLASEGDVLGTVTQIVTRALTGRVGSLLDMTSPQLASDRILMWHGGGGPLYMGGPEAAWVNHPMIGRGTSEGPRFGAIADFVFPDGPCTVLRVARSGTAAFGFEGMLRAEEESGFTGCRGWVTDFHSTKGRHSAGDIVTSVMEHGLEHHFVLVPGSFHRDFQEFAAWMAMIPLDIIAEHDGLPTGIC